MSYQHRLETAIDERTGALAWLIGTMNVGVGAWLAVSGYHFGAINVAAGIGVVLAHLYSFNTEGEA